MSPVGLFAASIWFVVGIVLVLAAFRSLARSKRFEAVARPANAVVVGIEDDTSTYVDELGPRAT